MKRKIYGKLLDWKKSNGKTAILVEGARRVGKSFIVEEFAKREYDNYLLLDFSKVGEQIKRLFTDYLDDLDTFFLYLQNLCSASLPRRKSVIIFDEVQFFPKARGAIKHLVADGRYDYIETGSLVSIHENVVDILIPSEEDRITMHPMDFEEFLWATGNDTLMDVVRSCYGRKSSLGVLHRKTMDLFRQWMIVGGMPQAVAKYVETKDFGETDAVKRGILRLYREDIRKHARKYALKVERIFDTIPSQLQRHLKRFQMASLTKEARYRDYQDAFMWLSDSMVCNFCYNTVEPSIGLEMNTDDLTLKCYMGDTGLLISHAFSARAIAGNGLYGQILAGNLDFNEGMVMENVVAQSLVANGVKLHFFSNYSKSDSASRMEIDFLLADEASIPSRVVPVEVKSGKRFRYNSLKKFRDKYGKFISTPIVLQQGDFREDHEQGVTMLPLYMAGLL